LLAMLPPVLQDEYRSLIDTDESSYELQLVKAADKISAYIKCIEEMRSGNREFARAEESLREAVEGYFYLEEVKYFCETFIESFRKTLDELD
jgi:5'-deoxynucleotidase